MTEINETWGIKDEYLGDTDRRQRKREWLLERLGTGINNTYK